MLPESKVKPKIFFREGVFELVQVKLSIKDRLFYSLRLGGWSKVFIPTFLGQAVGAIAQNQLSYSLLIAGCLQGLLFLLSLIFTNDLADEKVDQIKRKMFPRDSSPKTLTDDLLPKNLVRALAWIAPCLFLFSGFYFSSFYQRQFLGPLSLLILFSYSYSWPPLRLNYRFGGELLEAFGIGFCLPCYNAYLQSSFLWHKSYLFFIGFFFLALAHAFCSGICDKNSDIRGGKKTFAVNYGNRQTLLIIFVALVLALFSWLFLPGFSKLMPFWFLMIYSCIIFVAMKQFFSYRREEIEKEIKVQKEFRNFLHKLTSLLTFFLLCHLTLLLIYLR